MYTQCILVLVAIRRARAEMKQKQWMDIIYLPPMQFRAFLQSIKDLGCNTYHNISPNHNKKEIFVFQSIQVDFLSIDTWWKRLTVFGQCIGIIV